jgi:hypothetical protein
MPCYTIVKTPLKLTATPDELHKAIERLGVRVVGVDTNGVHLEDGTDLEVAGTGWVVYRSRAKFEAIQGRLKQSLQVVRALEAARKAGYRDIREEKEGQRVVIRCSD